MKERPQLALKFIGVLSERLKEAEEMLENLALGSIRKRLLFLLSKLEQSFGKQEGELIRIDIHLTHQDLANMIGTYRETVSATISEFVQEKIVIKKRFRKVIYVHREKLLKALNEV